MFKNIEHIENKILYSSLHTSANSMPHLKKGELSKKYGLNDL